MKVKPKITRADTIAIGIISVMVIVAFMLIGHTEHKGVEAVKTSVTQGVKK